MTFVSENDAGKMWCPNARVIRNEVFGSSDDYLPVGSANRDALGRSPNPIGSCVCIASKCMAWRWESYRRPEEQSPERRGYCGAFGIPLESVL